jgi:hypothetical protein
VRARVAELGQQPLLDLYPKIMYCYLMLLPVLSPASAVTCYRLTRVLLACSQPGMSSSKSAAVVAVHIVGTRFWGQVLRCVVGIVHQFVQSTAICLVCWTCCAFIVLHPGAESCCLLLLPLLHLASGIPTVATDQPR